MKNDRITPSSIFTHPLWWTALALLVINDHVWKGAGVLPAVLTGKLSDVAGLCVAPALLACLLHVRSKGGLFWCHLAVGLVFALINTSAACALAFETLTHWTPFPWRIVVDPSDLLTLPALTASWFMLRNTGNRAGRVRPYFAHAAFVLGMISCMATSPPECEDCGDFPPPPDEFFPFHEAALILGNESDDVQFVRVRYPAQGSTVDCDAVMQNPSSTLSRDLFGPPELWQLEPGRTIPIGTWSNSDWIARTNGIKTCGLALVDGSHLNMTLVAWDDSEFPLTLLPSALDEALSLPSLLMPVTGETSLSDHPAVFNAPPQTPPPASAACTIADETDGLSWEEPVPWGTHTIAALEAPAGGCLAIDLQDNGATNRWYLCMPGEYFPFAPGDEVTLLSRSLGHNFDSIHGIEMLGTTSEGGSITLLLGRGSDMVPLQDGTLETSLDPQCGSTITGCGATLAPVRITLESIPGEATQIFPSSGSPVAINPTTDVVVLRAFQAHAVTNACSAVPETGLHIESLSLRIQE